MLTKNEKPQLHGSRGEVARDTTGKSYAIKIALACDRQMTTTREAMDTAGAAA